VKARAARRRGKMKIIGFDTGGGKAKFAADIIECMAGLNSDVNLGLCSIGLVLTT